MYRKNARQSALKRITERSGRRTDFMCVDARQGQRTAVGSSGVVDACRIPVRAR